MGEHAQHLLGGQRRAAAGRERGAQPPLVPGEHALHLLALAIQGMGEGATHGPAIGRARPASGRPSVESHRGRCHAQLLSAEPVHVFRVVARIGRGRHEVNEPRRLAEHRREGGRVVRRPPAGERPDNEVRAGVDDDGQLGVARPAVRAGRGRAPVEPGVGRAVGRGVAVAIVGTGVPRVQARGIYRGNGPRGEQTTPGSAREADLLDPAEDPPFSAPARSRCAA